MKALRMIRTGDRRMMLLAFAATLLGGCGSGFEASSKGEEAFVGPHTLELRAELSPEAAVTAKIHHGDSVAVIERRRRFVKVRTGSGLQGWTDGNMLLSPDQMGRIRRLSRHAAELPSHGAATVLNRLNVHTGPNRQAPSFFQIQEGSAVDVLAHRFEARGPYQPPQFDRDVFPRPSYRVSPEQPVPPAGGDDWSLVRIPDGRAGWVLTRSLLMSIPDEVAQYAEGQRITSYFALGRVDDGGLTKRHWLWTTLSAGMKPYEFDSFRVFVWSLRRHRYETAYIERNLIGYYPVELHAAPEAAVGREAATRFSFILREKDGLLYRRTYAFAGQRVRLMDKVRWEPPEDKEPEKAAASAPREEAPEGGVFSTFTRLFRGLFE